ncbi:MAG: AAA family ATPase [Alphaproteobacteria bacterium]|nr:AAA family ATPase [Alphaproteobacteria bacterium]
MTITLTPQQSTAVKAIADWYGDASRLEFYLAGYAGTGKSTLTEIAIGEIKDRFGIKKVRTGAYTGKAAHVLRKKGAENARTIHSMTYRLIEDTGQPKFELDPHGAAGTADLIVLDECSMIDEAMANDLRSFGKKILVLGDPGQLLPVKGLGAFTSRQPDVFLTEIHRQAADSPILRLATMARMGKMPSLGDYGSGVRVVPYDADAGQWVYDRDTQVICGLNRVRWTLTQRIRAQRTAVRHSLC